MPRERTDSGDYAQMKEKISKERAAFLAKDSERGFVKYCHFKTLRVERGIFESGVRIREHHRQQDGFIHAGVMATMADHSAGYAAFTIVPEVYQILTIEFKINFLRPAFGDSLVCRSRVLREGSQIIICESEVYDGRKEEEEVMVAKALVTLMAVHKSKVSSKG